MIIIKTFNQNKINMEFKKKQIQIIILIMKMIIDQHLLKVIIIININKMMIMKILDLLLIIIN